MLSVWEERKVRLYGEHANVHQSHSQNDSGDLRGVAGGDGELVVRQAPVICVMALPIHLGAWSMALMLWLPFELYYFIHRPEIVCVPLSCLFHCVLLSPPIPSCMYECHL